VCDCNLQRPIEVAGDRKTVAPNDEVGKNVILSIGCVKSAVVVVVERNCSAAVQVGVVDGTIGDRNQKVRVDGSIYGRRPWCPFGKEGRVNAKQFSQAPSRSLPFESEVAGGQCADCCRTPQTVKKRYQSLTLQSNSSRRL
jgi:hypothetical protein